MKSTLKPTKRGRALAHEIIVIGASAGGVAAAIGRGSFCGSAGFVPFAEAWGLPTDCPLVVGTADFLCASRWAVINKTVMKGVETKTELSSRQRDELLGTLKARFEKHLNRHQGLVWDKVEARLAAKKGKLWSLHEMERTGGEPDVVGQDKQTGEFIFVDCSAESPKGRTSFCYDREGLDSRKEHKPENTVMDMAAAMGVELLTEEQYRELQKLGNFDLKTSSWVKTPADIRKLGGALFCDRRFGHVFVYHNGAQSYYGSRAFRASLRV